MRKRWTFYSRARSDNRSYRAEQAEEEGRLPLTGAVPVLAENLGITRKAARTYLEDVGTNEWHHVGRYATPVTYHDTNVSLDDYQQWLVEQGRGGSASHSMAAEEILARYKPRLRLDVRRRA